LAKAPNSTRYAIAWRPILTNPPVYSLADVKRLTLCEILDANEQLDLRDEVERRALARARKAA